METPNTYVDCQKVYALCRHKETWWWKEKVAKAVRDKKIKSPKPITNNVNMDFINISFVNCQEQTAVAWICSYCKCMILENTDDCKE